MKARSGKADAADRSTLLNVDLEVFSRVPLDRLTAAFGERVRVLYVGKVRERHAAVWKSAAPAIEPTPTD